jgi:type IV pilus assembly protein PilM
MSVLANITKLLADPPPAYAFEISEAGIAFAPTRNAAQQNFLPFEPGVLNVSPAHDNLQNPESFAAHVSSLVPAAGNRKRTAALILPDYCARLQVLDFDSFPAAPEEQLSLIRFRVKKTVPFDIESAAVSYHAQPPAGANRKIEVVAAVAALEIVSRYEAPFRTAGFQPGYVTTSGLAALSIIPPGGVSVAAKLSGRGLTVMVLEGERLRLARCVELDRVSSDDVLAVLHPTVAYVEDEIGARPQHLYICGFERLAAEWGPLWESELGLSVERLESRFGSPGPFNAGLLGYLHEQGAAA